MASPSSSRPPRPIRRGPAPPPPSTPLRTATTPTVKRVIWTGAFAAVAIVGSIYGAGLKTKQEFQAVRRLSTSSNNPENSLKRESITDIMLSQKFRRSSKSSSLHQRTASRTSSTVEVSSCPRGSPSKGSWRTCVAGCRPRLQKKQANRSPKNNSTTGCKEAGIK